MGKISSKKRRGIRKNLQKQSIRIEDAWDHSETESSSMRNQQLEQATVLAKKSWNLLLLVCSKLNLVPVVVDPVTGKVEPARNWKRCIHYILVTLCGVILVYRTYVAFDRVVQGRLDLVTYLCGGYFIFHFIAACACFGCTWSSTQPLCDIFSSCKSLERTMKMNMGQDKSLFDDKAVSIKVLTLLITINAAGLDAAFLTVVIQLPTAVLPTLTRMGFFELPPESFTRTLWAWIFLPFEMLTLLPTMLVTGICGISAVLGLGMFKVFADQVRKKRVRNMADWKGVYRLYRVIQVYNAILMDWFKNVAVLMLFSASCAIIILLYITVRPSDLHFLIYIWCPITDLLLHITLVWLCYDCVVTKRSVGEAVGNLDSYRSSMSFMRMDERSRAIMIRRIKSLRPAYITLGEFADISLDVAVNVWDEILNQLVFLLSL